MKLTYEIKWKRMKTDIPILLCIHTLIKTWHVALPRKKRKQKKNVTVATHKAINYVFIENIKFRSSVLSLHFIQPKKKRNKHILFQSLISFHLLLFLYQGLVVFLLKNKHHLIMKYIPWNAQHLIYWFQVRWNTSIVIL